MTPLVYLLYSVHSLMMQQAPAGTQLSVRLDHAVSSYATKPGNPLSGVVIAPVIVDGRIVIPAGSLVSGRVKSVTRVGYGIRYERASLGLEFDRLTIPGGDPIPFSSKVALVDNAREKVTSSGIIQGIRSTSTISYRVSGYIRTALLWDVHANAAEWAIKSLIVSLPEPEIYYPAGTEMLLRLTRKLNVVWPLEWVEDTEHLTEADRSDLSAMAEALPTRTLDPETKKASDITNVLLIGSREEIEQSFHDAGWIEAQPISIRNRIGCIRAAAEVHGFDGTPMSMLLLNGQQPEMSLHKSLNDVAKRHHVRIWRQPQRWYGQDVWLAAATKDIDFAYLRPGRTFTHEISPKVDEERDKIAYDLAFTGCARPLMWTARQGMPRLTHNATGDAIATDTRLVVIQMKMCEGAPGSSAPLLAANPAADRKSAPLAARGNKLQRFIRREIMITRSDFIRNNVYYRSYEGAKLAVTFVKNRRKKASDMRTLVADYGPAGSTRPVPPHHTTVAAIQTLR